MARRLLLVAVKGEAFWRGFLVAFKQINDVVGRRVDMPRLAQEVELASNLFSNKYWSAKRLMIARSSGASLQYIPPTVPSDLPKYHTNQNLVIRLFKCFIADSRQGTTRQGPP